MFKLIKLNPRFCSLFASLIFGNICFTQLPAFNENRIDFGSEIVSRAMHMTDMDSDGDLDIITFNNNTRVCWYENIGNGHFSLQRIISEGIIQESRTIRGADLDGDGDGDIIAPSYTDGKLYWIENLGGANFSSPILIDINVAGAYDVEIADLDNDGDLDIISGSYTGGYIHWYENDGAGNFISENTIANMGQVEDIQIADINNDGFIDVVCMGNSSFHVKWYSNNGLGSFTFEEVINTTTAGTDEICLTDSNGDGNVDIIIVSDAQIMKLYMNNGSSFGTGTNISLASGILNEIISADIDNDGDQDLVLARNNSSIGEIRWKRNLGGGTYQSMGNISKTGYDCVGLAITDIDGDTFKDVVSISYNGYKLTWNRNQGPLGLPFPWKFDSHIYLSSHYRHFRNGVWPGDMDNDGDIDVISASYRSTTGDYTESPLDMSIMYYENLGNGVYADPDSIAGIAQLSTASLYTTNLYDVDNDGDLDVTYLTTSSSLELLYWIENQGGGNFGNIQYISGTDNTAKYKFADMDADGDNDLLRLYNGNFIWEENIGGSNYSGPTHAIAGYIGITFSPDLNMNVVDIDSDGDLDIFTRDQVIGSYVYFENLGGGNFASSVTINSTLNNVLGEIADMNNDGFLDVVCYSNSLEIVWHENNGTGVFLPPVTIQSPTGVQNLASVRVADFNGDGYNDLILSENYGINWIEATSFGTYNPAAPLFDMCHYNGNTPMDYDFDGDMDILIEGDYCGRISWLENCANSNQVEVEQICQGESYFFDNQWISTSGTYYDTIYHPNGGCDLYKTLYLQVIPPSYNTINPTVCNSYTAPSGLTWTSSGTYYDTIPGVSSCDSIITINLTINPSVTSIDSHTACESFTWINGTTYTSSNNSDTYVLQNQNGCDSIVTLDLVINNNVTESESITACDSYTWIDGITYNSSNNSASYTVAGVAANGCDSIYYLDLTINNSGSYTDIIQSCGSYTWIDGITYNSSNNSATYLSTTMAGCDSLITLNLTINQPSTSSITTSNCESYTSPSGQVWTTSGVYSDIISNSSGCDSTITIDLTINSLPNVNLTSIPTLCIYNPVIQLDGQPSGGSFSGTGVVGNTFDPSLSGVGFFTITYSYTDINGCMNTDSEVLEVDGCANIQENDFGTNLNVFPNPTNGDLKITLGEVYNKSTVKVFNPNGKIVFNELFGSTDEINLNIKGASGNYILEINTEDGKTARIQVIKN